MNDIIETAEKLLQKEREYRELIGEEHNELAIAAANRGWQTTRYQRGMEMREEIAKLQAKWDEAKMASLKNQLGVITSTSDEDFNELVDIICDRLIHSKSDSAFMGEKMNEVVRLIHKKQQA